MKDFLLSIIIIAVIFTGISFAIEDSLNLLGSLRNLVYGGEETPEAKLNADLSGTCTFANQQTYNTQIVGTDGAGNVLLRMR